MTWYYLDSSVALRILLGHSAAAALWFDATTASRGDGIIASRLLRTEMTRALRRVGEPVERRDEVLDHLGTVSLDHAVLQEAEAIVPHITTVGCHPPGICAAQRAGGRRRVHPRSGDVGRRAVAGTAHP